MTVVKVALGRRTYPIHIAPQLLAQTGRLMAKAGLRGRVLLLSNKKVFRLYGAPVQKALAKHYTVYHYLIGDGERYKSLRTAEQVWRFLIKNKFERGDTIAALGGGVVGDLAGFAAAVYLRGINYVQIPTTLLAQTDSSIGGKTAVNDSLGKNLIGAFYQPKLVIADTATLRTLPRREILSGLGEVIKYGLIAGPKILTALNKRPDITAELIARCCQIKAKIVSADETEKNLRAVLNFGHTVGHALETYLHYRLRHGEAVALGMLSALHISAARGYLPPEVPDKIRQLYAKLGLPLRAGRRLDPEKIYRIIQNDKKVTDGRIRMVLLKDIGKTVICPVEYTEIARALEYIQ